MSLKDQAEFLARALESGLKTVPEIITWADENIMQLETPPYWLLELSLMGKAKGQDVFRVLSDVPGVADEQQVLAAFFASVFENVGEGAMSVESACRFLYPIRYRFSELQRRSIQDFDDRYDVTNLRELSREELRCAIQNFDDRYDWIDDPLERLEQREEIDRDVLASLERESNLNS